MGPRPQASTEFRWNQIYFIHHVFQEIQESEESCLTPAGGICLAFPICERTQCTRRDLLERISGVWRPTEVCENKPCAVQNGLVDCHHLQLERKTCAFVAKSALAGLLVFLLLFSSVLAVSSAHRQSHDFGRATPGHPCVFCLFAHGQISLS